MLCEKLFLNLFYTIVQINYYNYESYTVLSCSVDACQHKLNIFVFTFTYFNTICLSVQHKIKVIADLVILVVL